MFLINHQAQADIWANWRLGRLKRDNRALMDRRQSSSAVGFGRRNESAESDPSERPLHVRTSSGLNMSLTPIINECEVTIAYAKLVKTFETGANTLLRKVGWPGGHGQFPLHWHPKEGVWALFAAGKPHRYSCGFGTINPEHRDSVQMVCHINPPRRGINRRCQGVFLTDHESRLYLATPP